MDSTGIVKSLKAMYCRFLSKQQCVAVVEEDITLIAHGGVNSVWRVKDNDAVVLKYSRIRPHTQEADFAASKTLVWDTISRMAMMQDAQRKALLDNVLLVPFYRELVYDDKGGALMTIERFVQGVDLKDIVTGDTTEAVADLPAILYIVADVMMFLYQVSGFNHNDFHMGNVMVVPSERCFERTYHSLTEPGYTMPMPAHMPIILDFDWAVVSPVLPSQERVFTDLQKRMEGVRQRYPQSTFAKAHTHVQTHMGSVSNKIDSITLLLDLTRSSSRNEEVRKLVQDLSTSMLAAAGQERDSPPMVAVRNGARTVMSRSTMAGGSRNARSFSAVALASLACALGCALWSS